MKSIISTLAAAAVLAVAAPAHADNFRVNVTVQPAHRWQHAPVYRHPFAGLQEINMRQARQRERIEMGLHNGTITRWEFRRLMAEQHDIQAMERAFVADGFLSDRERFELNRRLDFARQHIRWEASDFERRY